jgi:precorrin-6Y C5,15-methyltransferase (decarboxylating)
MNEKVHIIGVGDDGLEGLTSGARQLIDTAQILIGSQHALDVVPDADAERLCVGDDPDDVVQCISRSPGKRIVILMTGDPLFYGTTRFLCERLGKERFEVVPHVSAVQLAFARVKESWDEAYLADLATQGLDRVVEQCRTAEKVGLFTTDEISPSAVARALLDRRIDYFTAYVCENLGSPDERVTSLDLADVADHEYSLLNVMILVRKPDRPDRPRDTARRRLFGNVDEAFLQSQPKRGLLTPAEVRCIALAEMDLAAANVVWDVGAGSGSMAIEAALVAPHAKVYAIEMDIEDHQLISANATRFDVQNLTSILGKAPEAWADLPEPDAIFVGGTGRRVSHIVRLAFEQLRAGGRLIANVGSVENVAAVREVLQEGAEDDKVWMINIARGVYQIERVRFESLNPTFLIGASKHG